MSEAINVVDYLKYWKNDAVKAYCDSRRHNFSVLIENSLKDLNVANIVRSCNAFLAKQIILFDRKQYDRRGAVYSYRYENFLNIKTISELRQWISKQGEITVIGVDNISGARPIDNFQWDYNKHTVLCFGHEGEGIRPEILSLCDNLVYIKQYGATRSLNVAVAAGIVMNDYCCKMDRGISPAHLSN